MIDSKKKTGLIMQAGRHKKDVGSSEVQITLLTARIGYLTQHLKKAKKDHMARRGLLQLVGQRRRLLRYLAKKDLARYKAILKKVNLRK